MISSVVKFSLRQLSSFAPLLLSTKLPGDLKTMGPPARKRIKRSKSPLESSKRKKKKEEEQPKKKVPKEEVLKKSDNLKITSWNVDGLRAWIKKGSLSFILETDQPDILCLQETKCSKSKLPPEIDDLSEIYPHQYWAIAEKEGYSGVGLFSKIKPLKVEIGLDVKEHDKEGRCIIAEYDAFILLTTYVPNAGRKLVTLDKRMDWDPHLRAKLKELDKRKPVVACGDFNVAHTEIDLANPKTNKKNAGFTPEERAGFDELLALGFVDTFRKLNPEKTGAYTFWTYMMNSRAKNVGWRLDYFLVSERWFESNVSDSVIQSQVMGSDHCPLSLLLRV